MDSFSLKGLFIQSNNTKKEMTRARIVFDTDEKFETYDYEIERVSDILAGEELWANTVKKVHA